MKPKDLTAEFESLKAQQAIQSDKLSLQATAVAARALSPALVASAANAVASVAKDRGRGGLGEPAADLRDIRTDNAFQSALVRDLRLATAQSDMLISGALSLGYASQVNGTPLNGATLTYAPDMQSRAALDAYPILGETAKEHAAAITEALRRDILRAAGLPLTGQADFTKIAEALGVVSDQHAKRVGAAVSEAYFAGVQAGVIDAARALVRS